MKILPFEGAHKGHEIFERANSFFAIKRIKSNHLEKALTYIENSKRWPKNLGVGKPYDPDVRLRNYLKASISRKQGKNDRAREVLEEIRNYTLERPPMGG